MSTLSTNDKIQRLEEELAPFYDLETLNPLGPEWAGFLQEQVDQLATLRALENEDTERSTI